MSGIYFRPTDYPDQERLLDPFTPLDYNTENTVTRMMMAPFFGLTGNTKLLPVVCPGGYLGEECFKYNYSGTTISIGPGYSIVDEVLLESKNTVNISLTDRTSYFDYYPSSGVSYSGWSGLSGYSNYTLARVYVLLYYYPYSSKQSGYSGLSGSKAFLQQNYNKLIIGLSSDRNTYLNNRTRYCYLYTIYATFYNRNIVGINNVYYTDPVYNDMTRYYPW